MTDDPQLRLRRRKLLKMGAALPLALAAATLPVGSLSRRNAMAATPACGDGPTPRQTSGPFFKPDSPQRESLVEAGAGDDAMTLAGRVLSTSCEPVAGALIDFWHCDSNGKYDNNGYRFRGHQFSNAAGQFYLETSIPGLYPGRTRHIHVTVQAPNRLPVTTQLYFPDERWNEKDFIFRPVLLLKVTDEKTPMRAQFDFVLDLG